MTESMALLIYICILVAWVIMMIVIWPVFKGTSRVPKIHKQKE